MRAVLHLRAYSWLSVSLVVVPTYNERVNLPLVVPAILQQDPRLEVLVVDDNSPDGTGQLADELAASTARVHVLHRPAKSGLGKAYLAGFRWALEQEYDLIFEMDADFSHDPKFLGDFVRAADEADVVIGSRYRTGVNVINWPISRLLLSIGANRVRPLDHRAAAGGLDRWLQVLPPRGARGDRLRQGALQRLLLSDRDELPGLEEGVPPGGDSHRVHRPGRGTEQDEQAHRPGGDLDGLVAPASIAHGTAVRGTLFYKMTGSGNDFVMLDGRATSPDRWPPDRVRAICDRRNGVGADGLVILTPDTPGSVRMSYWNSDGSHGAMCGNAALCSGRLSVDLELVRPGEFCLLTDAGVVRVISRAQADRGGDQAAGLRPAERTWRWRAPRASGGSRSEP